MNTETSARRTFARLPLWTVAASLLSTSLALTAQQPGYGYPQQGYDQQSMQGDQQADPPSRVGRLSILQGNVSFQPQGAQDFSAAEINYPLTNGDRLYTDTGALTELQAGQLALRLSQQTDLTVTALDDQTAVFGLAQGSVHLRAYALDPNTNTELDTPNASIVVTQPGDVRVDVSPQGDSTIITVLSGAVQVSAEGVDQMLAAGQSLGITGVGQSFARRVGRPRQDVLDSFSADRDRIYQSYFTADSGYVNSDTIGASDLGAYGDWGQDNDYGAVWYPRGVAADWAPYTNGHWVSVAPWGWTWVGYEPWGFAPFHYGRWNRFGNRWGWVPGPSVVRPVYSPALVAFVGGGGFSLSIGGGGGGVAAWFPLGPREVYRPWYRSSPVYVNRVNVTNIYSRNQTDVRRIYNSRTNVYANVTINNYVNRGPGTVAISARDFGSRRAVRDVQIRGAQARQFANAPVMDRPPVAAPSRPVAGPAVRAVPPRGTQRPVFDSRNDARNGQGGNQRPNGSFRTRDTDNNHSGPDGYFTNRPTPGQPSNGGNNPPNRNSNPQNRDSNQPANGTAAPVVRPGQGGAENRNNGGNDNRFNRGNTPAPGTTVAPVAPTQVQPTTPAQQPNRDNRYNNGGNNDNRFNRGNQDRNNPAPATTVTPAAPTQGQPAAPVQQPYRDNRYNNGGNNDNRFNRGNQDRSNPTPATTVTPAAPTQVQPAAPVQQPNRDNNGNRDNRFNNGGDRGNRPQQTTAPTVTAPSPVQQPAPAVTPQVPRVRPNPDVNMNPRFERPQTQGQPQPQVQQRSEPMQRPQAAQQPQVQRAQPQPQQARPQPAPKPEEKKN